MYGESPPKRRATPMQSKPEDSYRPPEPIVEEMIGYGEATQTGVEPQYGPHDIPEPAERPPDPPHQEALPEPIWAERVEEPSFEEQVQAAEQEEREAQAAKAEQEELKRQEELRLQREQEQLQREQERLQKIRGGPSPVESYGGFMDEIAPRALQKKKREEFIPRHKLTHKQPDELIQKEAIKDPRGHDFSDYVKREDDSQKTSMFQRKLKSDPTPATTDYTTADESQNIVDDIINLGATTSTGVTPVTVTEGRTRTSDFLEGVGGVQITGSYPGGVKTLEIDESTQTAQRGRFAPTGYAPEFTETVDTRGIHGSSIFPETTEILLGERGSRGPRYTTVKPVDDPDVIGGVYQGRSRKSKDISVSQPQYTTPDKSQDILSDIVNLGATASTGIETSADYMDMGTPTRVPYGREGQVTTTTDRRMRSGGSGGQVARDPKDRGVNLIDALVSKTTDDYDGPKKPRVGAAYINEFPNTLAAIEEERQRRARQAAAASRAAARGESGTEVGRTSPRAGRPAPQVFDDMGNVIGTTKTTPRPPMTTSTGKFKGHSVWSKADVTGPEMAERRFGEEHAPGRSDWSIRQDPTYQSFMNVLSPSRYGIQTPGWGSAAQVGSPDDPLNVMTPNRLWNITLDSSQRHPVSNQTFPMHEQTYRTGRGLGNQSMIPGTSFTEWESQLGGLMGGRAQPGQPTEISRVVAPDLIEPRSEWQTTTSKFPKAPPRGALRGKIAAARAANPAFPLSQPVVGPFVDNVNRHKDMFGGIFGDTFGAAKAGVAANPLTKKASDLFSGL